MAAVRRKVAQVEAEAQQVVSEYYKEFDQHPELRIFLDDLRAAEAALRDRTTLILDTAEAPWSVFDAEARKRIPLDGAEIAAGATGTVSQTD